MSWECKTLEECTEYITDGDHQPAPKSDEGVLFIKIKDIKENRIDFKEALHVPQVYYDGIQQNRKPVVGDTLYTVVGSYGLSAYVNFDIPFCFERNIALLHPQKNVDSRFLFYSVSSPDFFKQAENAANGAAQKLIPLSRLKKLKIQLPSLEIQKKIVDILSSYDNLIENNQKQIKLLEEAAQRLYKQWFIDLKFPGHETTKIVDGLLEGWKKKIVMDFISQEIGGGWGEDDIDQKSSRPAFVIRGADIDGVNHGDFLNIPFRFHSESNLEQRILQDGDIVFEVSGGSKTEGVAKTLLITTRLLEQYSSPVICASFCKKIRPKEGLSQYFYDALQYMRMSGVTSEYDKKSASSIVNYRWKDFLSQQCLMLPSENILRMYDKIAKPIYKSIQTKSIEIEKLKRARNSLLPKLMSGEIEVLHV